MEIQLPQHWIVAIVAIAIKAAWYAFVVVGLLTLLGVL